MSVVINTNMKCIQFGGKNIKLRTHFCFKWTKINIGQKYHGIHQEALKFWIKNILGNEK